MSVESTTADEATHVENPYKLVDAGTLGSPAIEYATINGDDTAVMERAKEIIWLAAYGGDLVAEYISIVRKRKRILRRRRRQ